MIDSIHQFYGNKLRIRACGIFIENDQLLLVKHIGLSKGVLWSVPGGGIEIGESASDAIIREFREETGLRVEVGDFLFATEFIMTPLHAIELFFLVQKVGGKLITGKDPEFGDRQIIQEVRFMNWTEIKSLDREEVHGIFSKVAHPQEILKLRGYFKL